MIFLSLGLVNASNFNTGNSPESSILGNYIKDSYLSGYVNISFNQIPIDAVFGDSLENHISLIDVLESSENSDFNYSCSSNCTSTYLALNPEKNKLFNLPLNSSKLVGFKFQESLVSIDNISFDIFSSASKNCDNQISIDILNDGVIDYINEEGANSMCTEVYKGCATILGGPSSGTLPNSSSYSQPIIPKFIDSILIFFKFKTGKVIQTSEIIITETPLCQRIKFPQAPGYRVGAWIKEETTGTKQFNMGVYKLNGEKIDECSLSKAGLPQGGSAYLDCQTNFYLIKSEDLYVCLYSTSGTGKFKTRGYVPQNESCAFQGIPPQTEVAAYDIYIKKEQFNKPAINIENQISSNEILSDNIKGYIIQKYGGLNCSSGCIVPIKIYSHTNQDITINNISVIYKGSLGQTESKDIYDINEDKAKISSTYQKLYLDGFFKLPSNSGQIDYILNLDNNKVFNKNINVENISMTLTPTIIGKGVSTKISVFFSPNQNIKEYNWDFGNGKTTNTLNNSARNIYLESGMYSIKVNSKTSSSNKTYFKSFLIQVVEPEIILDKIINQKIEDLDKVKEKISLLESFSGEKLKEILKVDEKQDRLDQLKKDFQYAETEEQIKEIANSVLEIEIPEELIITSIDESRFLIKSENVNIDILSSITREDYDPTKNDAYAKAIVNWSDNVKIDLSSKKINSEINGESKEDMNVYYLKFTKNNNEPYLIIKNLENFASTENFIEKGEYNYVKLDGNKNQITIVTTENLNSEELPLFIAPEISELQLIEDNYENSTIISKKKFDLGNSWIYILIGVVVLIILIFIIRYLKKPKKIINEEEKLFPNRNNLYNLVSYINNAKRAGKTDLDIEKDLKKAKWNNKQIKYAIEKYSNKK